MTFLEKAKHYNELIANAIDELENALDDDMPDKQSEIEQLIDEFHSEIFGLDKWDKADFQYKEIKESGAVSSISSKDDDVYENFYDVRC